jgi:hypothetical protein
MTEPRNDLVDASPAEVTERLRLMTQLDTSSSRPWPGMQQALRRDRRRRVAGASVLAAASVLAVAVAVGSLLTPGTNHAAPADDKPFVPTLVGSFDKPLTLAQSGFTGQTGGSLAQDKTWVDGVRARAVMLAHQKGAFTRDVGGDPAKYTKSPSNVLVQWTGEIEGARYAVVLVQNDAHPTKPESWLIGVLAGPANGPASELKLSSSQGMQAGSQQPEAAENFSIPAENPDAKHPGVLFVAAPLMSQLEVVTHRTLTSKGKTGETYRQLTKPKSGGIWVTPLTATEQSLSSWRYPNVKHSTTVMDYSKTVAVFRKAPELVSLIEAIAPPGTDLRALKTAIWRNQYDGGSILDTPVFALSSQVKAKVILTVTVLRTPGGGYRFAFTDNNTADKILQERGGVLTSSPGKDPESMLIAQGEDTGRRFRVLAPEGATSVKINGTTAPVKGRLAYLYTPGYNRSPTTKVQAMDSSGKVIATRNVTFTGDMSAQKYH